MPFTPKIDSALYDKGKAAFDNGMSARGFVDMANRLVDEVHARNSAILDSHPNSTEAPPGYVDTGAASFSLTLGFMEGVLGSIRRLHALPKPPQRA